MKQDRADDFLHRFTDWAKSRPDIRGLALVGSYARGAAREDSDVDLVILSKVPGQYLSDLRWAARFGDIKRKELADYGKLTSVRVWYSDGLEVEYGITDESWAALPLDEGTREVISGGMKVLLEQGDILSRHLRQPTAGRQTKESS